MCQIQPKSIFFFTILSLTRYNHILVVYLSSLFFFLLHSPKCRTDYPMTACPNRYLCFCGKEKDPPAHPWLAPHTCGQTCERPLRPECGHRCLLLCHPGKLDTLQSGLVTCKRASNIFLHAASTPIFGTPHMRTDL